MFTTAATTRSLWRRSIASCWATTRRPCSTTRASTAGSSEATRNNEMKLEYDVVPLETLHPFHIARAAAPPARYAVQVRLRDAEGAEGMGEAAPSAFYGESAETVNAVLARPEAALAEELRHDGRERPDVYALERIERALAHAVGGNAAARVAVSSALHDLIGKRLGVPVWQLWGLDPAAAPLSSFTIGLDEPEVMRERVREARGYP